MKLSTPHRVTRQRTISIEGDVESVFPLFCPVREVDWLESWKPGVVLSHSGVVETGCVFTSTDANGTATWLVTDHDAQAHQLTMVKFTPGFTVCKLEIQASQVDPTRCNVTVAYSHTALSDAGAAFVETFTEDHYDQVMAQWKKALEHYLTHGSPLPGS